MQASQREALHDRSMSMRACVVQSTPLAVAPLELVDSDSLSSPVLTPVSQEEESTSSDYYSTVSSSPGMFTQGEDENTAPNPFSPPSASVNAQDEEAGSEDPTPRVMAAKSEPVCEHKATQSAYKRKRRFGVDSLVVPPLP